MRTITIEELEQINGEECCIVDIRSKEQYDRGTFPGAVNIPADQFEELLEEDEYDAVNINGGYRAYLKLSLSRYMQKESDEKRQEKTAEIERSIIKKFRKTIWRPFTKALNEYQLIQEGDRIAVCISGGKDSMLLAKLIQELKKHGKISFEAVFLVMNPGYNADNWKIIQDNAKLLGIPLTVFESNSGDYLLSSGSSISFLRKNAYSARVSGAPREKSSGRNYGDSDCILHEKCKYRLDFCGNTGNNRCADGCGYL